MDVAEIVVRRSRRYQQMTADERSVADSRFADVMDEDMDEEIGIDNYPFEDDEPSTYRDWKQMKVTILVKMAPNGLKCTKHFTHS